MWSVFTYLYNSMLIIFIAAHLLVGAIICFGVGVYTGIYLSQNYEIPKINEPYNLWDKFVKSLEQVRKHRKASIETEELVVSEMSSRDNENDAPVNLNPGSKSS